MQWVLRVRSTVIEVYVTTASDEAHARHNFDVGDFEFSHEVDRLDMELISLEKDE